MERRELQQRIITDMTVHVDVIKPEEQLGAGAELRSVGRDGEVTFDPDARNRGVQDADGQARGAWEWQCRRTKAWMESANGYHEIGIIAEGDEQAHLAFQRHVQDARFEQRGEKID